MSKRAVHTKNLASFTISTVRSITDELQLPSGENKVKRRSLAPLWATLVPAHSVISDSETQRERERQRKRSERERLFTRKERE